MTLGSIAGLILYLVFGLLLVFALCRAGRSDAGCDPQRCCKRRADPCDELEF
jgi:hypothetical protein